MKFLNSKELNDIHLIADNSKNNRKILKYYLKNNGFFIEEIETGEDLIEIIDENKNLFSVIWLDADMIDLDGCQCSNILRNEIGFNGLIVGITSNVDNDQILCYKTSGMNEVLIKPFQEKDLLNIMFKYNIQNNKIKNNKDNLNL